MSRSRRSPRPLGLALELKQAEWAPATLLGEIQGVWGDVVGAGIAAEATPTWERAGVLTVACSASVWAQELDLMAPSILPRLNAIITRGQLTRLRCIATPPRESP